MGPAFLGEVEAAVARVRSAPGVFFLALNSTEGGWRAAVALDEVRHEAVIADGDPAVHVAEAGDAAGAIGAALASASRMAEAAGKAP